MIRSSLAQNTVDRRGHRLARIADEVVELPTSQRNDVATKPWPFTECWLGETRVALPIVAGQ